MRKRIFCLLLAMTICLGITACGGNSGSGGGETNDTYELGLKFLSEGNYEEAIIHFMAAIDIDPKKPEPYVSLAQAYLADGQITKVGETIQLAVEQVGLDGKLTVANTEIQVLEDGRWTLRERNEEGKMLRFVQGEGGWCFRVTEYDPETGLEISETQYNEDGSVESTTKLTWDLDALTLTTVYQYLNGTNTQDTIYTDVYQVVPTESGGYQWGRSIESSVASPLGDRIEDQHYWLNYLENQVTITVATIYIENGTVTMHSQDSQVYTMASAENEVRPIRWTVGESTKLLEIEETDSQRNIVNNATFG